VGAIERGTVLVLAGSAAGSGFFVSEELLVTNRHVVEGGGPLLVAGRHVGVLQAVLVRAGGAGPLEDFALLRVPRQSGVRPMALAAPGRPLTPVVAAGFPGLHLATDPIFQRLREGDGEASRSLEPVFQTGVVNHLQPQAEGVTLVVHGAEIAPGNSGGPLVDYCGRVMGVNTFGRTDDRLPITARYALGTDGLTAFLRAAGVDAPVDTGPCALEAPSPAVAEATPPRAAPLPAPAAAQADATPHPEPTPRPQDRSASPARAPSR
jgi:S1-C subfamily serine protease